MSGGPFPRSIRFALHWKPRRVARDRVRPDREWYGVERRPCAVKKNGTKRECEQSEHAFRSACLFQVQCNCWRMMSENLAT